MEHQAVLELLKNILKLCQAGPPLKSLEEEEVVSCVLVFS
jgi:hypothetical protein